MFKPIGSVVCTITDRDGHSIRQRVHNAAGEVEAEYLVVWENEPQDAASSRHYNRPKRRRAIIRNERRN